MHLRSLILAALAACSVAGPAVSQEQQAYTTREMEALKGRAPDRVARADLLSVLRPVKEIRSGMFVMLHGVGFETQPYATEFAGLCRKDTLWLSYAPLEEAKRGRDAPLAPQGLTAYAFFAPLGTLRKLAGTRSIPVVVEGACAQRGDEGWIGASDAETVVVAARLIAPLEERLRARALKPSSCSLHDDKKDCTQTVLDILASDELNSAGPCRGAAPIGRCLRLGYGGDTDIEVHFTRSDDDRVPGAIEAVTIEQYIIVT